LIGAVRSLTKASVAQIRLSSTSRSPRLVVVSTLSAGKCEATGAARLDVSIVSEIYDQGLDIQVLWLGFVLSN
jgi:hypothetical protein